MTSFSVAALHRWPSTLQVQFFFTLFVYCNTKQVQTIPNTVWNSRIESRWNVTLINISGKVEVGLLMRLTFQSSCVVGPDCTAAVIWTSSASENSSNLHLIRVEVLCFPFSFFLYLLSVLSGSSDTRIFPAVSLDFFRVLFVAKLIYSCKIRG